MRDYLLDTNIWSDWYNPTKNSNILQHLEQLHTTIKLHISVITFGEIDYGYNVMPKKEQSRETEFRKFISSKTPITVLIDKHVAKTYGELRARLFEKYAPKKKRTKGLRPEQLIDPVTSLEIGIQENDLWIAAQATSRNLTLVTSDAMERIREVAGDELHIENWTKK